MPSTDLLIPSGALVLYHGKPARVANAGERLELELGGETQRVRPKDVVLLHPGPLNSLAELVPLGGEMRAAWEILAGGTTPPWRSCPSWLLVNSPRPRRGRPGSSCWMGCTLPARRTACRRPARLSWPSAKQPAPGAGGGKSAWQGLRRARPTWGTRGRRTSAT